MKNKLFLLVVTTLLINPAHAQECVILLHGLAKTHQSMSKIADSLDKEGYITVNYDYPSRNNSIEILAKKHVKKALKECPASSKIHFVTHSMGGILVRQYLQENLVNNLGRVVMLGPPNQGSEVVDKLQWLPGYSYFGGPAAFELGTNNDSIPDKLAPPYFDLGIIAGTRSINPFLSMLLPSHDDGKVSVENTKLEGMKEHITLPVTHPFMMKNSSVITYIKSFLKNGTFAHSPG